MARWHLAFSASALGVGAFMPPSPHNKVTLIGLSSNDNGAGDPVFFDDFGDSFVGGDDSPSSSSPSSSSSSYTNTKKLVSRMSQVKDAEAAYDAKLARNWNRGNWGVRGFALDKSSSVTQSTSKSSVRVSVVAAPTSSTFDEISLPQDKALPQDKTVAVGRTDGSVFIVKLGEEYITSFMAVPKMIDDEGGTDEDSARVQNEWRASNQIEDSLHNTRSQMPEQSGMGVGGDQTAREPSAFEIKHQFLASRGGETIHSLVLHDTAERSDCDGVICAAAGSSGEISIWTLPSSASDQTNNGGATLVDTLSGGHYSQIISLEVLVLYSDENRNEQTVLFSASKDGAIALWDLDKNGELIYSCQCMEPLTCADVSNPSALDNGVDEEDGGAKDVIFLGSSAGYVMGFLVQDLLSASDAKSMSECPAPNIRFRTSRDGEAVTAIKCGGDGTIPTSDRSQERRMGRNPRLSSSILLTGGEDGSVKQWEILSQNSPSGIRMEHWPRMSTQRVKRRAHLFSPGHEGAVSSIAQQNNDPSKFLTCGEDGSLSVWSASTGKELYSMDGFSESISSMAFLGRELLVTDGMEQYVCVHDFGIEEDAAETGYDLEW